MKFDSKSGAEGAQDGLHAASPAFQLSAPSVSLPKGGGAVSSMGEKFGANPATGSGSFSLPLPASPERAGFGIQLALSYDSAQGNGPFGMGWHLSLPVISRKTDRGLPQYLDDEDIFVLAGSEDLVPVLDAAGQPVPDDASVAGYAIRRYRPRIEALFARIERWTRADGDVHWRLLSADNVLSIFGADDASRVVDPEAPARVFSWLLAEVRDDRGNAAVYTYKPENDAGVDLGKAHERHRRPVGRSAQRYIQRIRYGNRVSLLDQQTFERPLTLEPSAFDAAGWMFELVFDYGEYSGFDSASPGQFECTPDLSGAGTWAVRPDPQSNYRAGFERRTYRRCRRVFMLHHFAQDASVGDNCLIRSLELHYRTAPVDPAASDPGYSFLDSAQLRSFQRNLEQTGRYRFREQPPVEFRYSEAVIATTSRDVDPASLENLPVGLGDGHRWIDLDGEGLSGILSARDGAWYYKANLGPADPADPRSSPTFAPQRVVATLPALAALASGRQQLIDVDGNGALDLVDFHPPLAGFHERDIDDSGWKRFVPFANLPNIDWNEPNMRFVDLTGDGHADVLITEQDVFTWYPSLAAAGFDAARRVATPSGESDGPRVVFADGEQAIYLADMSGDGLADLVRIRNGETSYWPNLGYGRFGRQVVMDDAPWFDRPEHFDQRRVRLADIDGSGTTDLIYLGSDGARLWFNRSGNGWSGARALPFPVSTNNVDQVQVADLMGNGTACLVWSSNLPGDNARPMRFLDLMGGVKPHLMVGMRNNLGAETTVDYVASTHFYLADKAAGTPWATRLPFPVHCVARVTVTDAWRKTTFATTYTYHHGHFDSVEREFRGFGRVEQVDTQDFDLFTEANARSPFVAQDGRLFQAPVKTVSWFHTGIAEDRDRLLGLFADEYFPARFASRIAAPYAERELTQPDVDVLDGPPLSAAEWREATRACKGMVLRQESYELDPTALANGTQLPVRLFSAAQHNCRLRRLQPLGTNPHAVFLAMEEEAISYAYELDLAPASLEVDPRIAHTLHLSFDGFGHALESVAVVYPRRVAFADAVLDAAQVARIVAVQSERHLAYTQARFTDLPVAAGPPDTVNHRVPAPCEVRTFELTGDDPLTGFAPSDQGYFRVGDFTAFALGAGSSAAGQRPVTSIAYEQLPADASAHLRLIEHARTLYFDAGDGIAQPARPLAFGSLGSRALKYQDYKLALTDGLLAAVFETRMDAELSPNVTARTLLATPATSGYADGSDFDPMIPGEYWMRSGVAGFGANAASRFYTPESYTDPFGRTTTAVFDDDLLYLVASTDTLGNESRVEEFDHRVLAPTRMRDANGNVSTVAFDVFGLPVVSAVLGKVVPATGTTPEQTQTGDTLDEFDFDLLNPAPSDVAAFFQAPTLDEVAVRTWLGKAGARFVYHHGERRDAAGGVVAWAAEPAAACGIAREKHEVDAPNTNLGDPALRIRLQVGFEYSDGMGQAFVKKVQAEPAPGSATHRWIANGKTIVNNKGKPVLQYEPYFSTDDQGQPDHRFQEPRAEGVTPVLSYDAPGRLVRTDLPDGSITRVEFTPWLRRIFDQNDTVLDSDWFKHRGSPDPARPRPADENGRAAWLAAQHANTPAQTHLDSLGRDVVAIAWNRTPGAPVPLAPDESIADRPWIDERMMTFTRLDAEGKALWIVDARGNLVMQFVRRALPDPATGKSVNQVEPEVYTPCYDIAGNLLFQHGMDAGDRWMLSDSAGKPMLAWDANESRGGPSQGRVFQTRYDELHRPLEQWLTLGAAAPALIEAFEYIDTTRPGHAGLDEARKNNLVGTATRHWDPSGLATVERIDVTGAPAHVTRTLIKVVPDPTDEPDALDWAPSRSAPLDDETFESITERDAMGRMTRLFNWHRGDGTRVAVYEPQYNARGVLQAEDLVEQKHRADHDAVCAGAICGWRGDI